MTNVNGDGSLTPLDVLSVNNAINALDNRQPTIVGGLTPDSDPNNNGVVLIDRVAVRRGNSIQDWNAAALDIVRQWTS